MFAKRSRESSLPRTRQSTEHLLYRLPDEYQSMIVLTKNECLYMARSSMDVPEKTSAVVGNLRINVAGDVLGPCKLKT